MEDHSILIKSLLNICEQASTAILDVYQSEDFEVESKDDNSPVTKADLAAHNIIKAGLTNLTPDIPQLSEEDTPQSFQQRRSWTHYWCIDPLDGTKEFLQQNDEFTINIALIKKHQPVLGIIYIPVTGTAYWGSKQLGAWKKQKGHNPVHIRSKPLGENLIVAASRRHGIEENENLLKPIETQFKQIRSKGIGSSLKMCLIAEGLADFYPRLFPTSEWDTAASQAILEAAGGRLVNANSLEPLRYNQKSSLTNPNFFACGDPQFPLEELLQHT